MKRLISLALMLGLSLTVFGIDKDLAKKYDEIFSQFTHQFWAKSPISVKPKELLEMIKKGEDIVLLDIRTPQEMSVVGITYRNALQIPMNELFKEENLKKIPRDKKVIVVCRSGGRALVATVALRSVGFNNVYVLKGGISKLAAYLSPKTTAGMK
ncbi:MAG: rhodanese-like domain-containing protein [Aquificae bacterium]|nr:rhodanese-like domain-containing protein [Aquificota bacterium]